VATHRKSAITVLNSEAATSVPQTLIFGTPLNHIDLRYHKPCSKGLSRHTAFALSSERSHSCHLCDGSYGSLHSPSFFVDFKSIEEKTGAAKHTLLMIYPSSGPFVALRPKSKLQRAHGRSCEGGTTRSIREDIRVNRQSQHHSALQFACARWCKLPITPILPSRLSKLRRKEPPNSPAERHQGTSPPPSSQSTQTTPQGHSCAPQPSWLSH
jgi:hypothetical protein